jgi:hypothetical protein
MVEVALMSLIGFYEGQGKNIMRNKTTNIQLHNN